MDSLELPGWAIDSPIRNADSPIEVSDENERVPHLPSDTVMAPPTGQLPSAPFYFGGALSNKIQVIEDPPERHVRAAFKFWAVYELLPSGAGLAEIWVFTRVCQSIYLRPANATPSLYRSLIQGYWMPWNRFYSGVWGQLHSVRARLVPRVDYIRLDGTYKLFDRMRLPSSLLPKNLSRAPLTRNRYQT